MEEPPTDEYYDLLRKDMGHRHPKTCTHLLDHLVSLEDFLDKSVLFGFSFEVGKVQVCVAGKLLGHSIGRPGAEFPAGGLGSSTTAGCKAFNAIKNMMCDHITLAAFDEAAAADGSCPLEQVADPSGIAVGGSLVQMSRDMAKLKVLVTHSKSLTAAQQNLPPLIQEAFAQLEVKRATR